MKCLMGLVFLLPVTAVTALAAGPNGSAETVANIRVIGGGGGEDEMVELSRVAEIKEYLMVCQYPGNPCELSEKQNLLVSELLKQDKVLEFSTAANVPLDWNDLRDYLFSKVKWKVTNIALPKLKVKIRVFHHQRSQNKTRVYAIHDEGHIADLSPLVTGALACVNGATGFQLTSRPQTSMDGFTSQMEWSCGGARYGATLRLSSMGKAGEEVLDWKTGIFSVRMIEDKPKACPDQLAESRN